MTGTTGATPGLEAATTRREPNEVSHEHTNLVRRYGRIGIEAVAAVLPYTDVSKTPVPAPVVTRIDSRFIETAA